MNEYLIALEQFHLWLTIDDTESVPESQQEFERLREMWNNLSKEERKKVREILKFLVP